ncbi:MAG: DNA-deoxyinosine glycosylase [Oscillospiraceae bacterium]|jgi:hypoxanthine-DNA glycosylase|nr:DNA-deoxyinosine glycosylase [Oscillospiraceae bacterium]
MAAVSMATLTHPFAPVWDARSRVLILGSFPSPRSRAFGFYYGHPQNAFWRTLAQALSVPEPATDKAAKRTFLHENHIALWDVLHSCEIRGADDASIRNPVPHQFRPLLDGSDIRAIFTTGKAATALFNRLAAQEAGMVAQYLPSTSPANRGRWQDAAFHTAWAAVRTAVNFSNQEDA